MARSYFAPAQQNFTLLMGDGTTPFQVNMADLDASVLNEVEICINYGSQIGASIIMLVVVLLVTRKAKRKSLIFPINVLSLILSVLRSLLQTLYWVGPFTEIYAYFSGDYTAVPRSAYNNSIAAIVMTLLLLVTVETSLVLQTHVILRLAMRNRYRYSIMVVSIMVALLAIGFRFAEMVLNAIAIFSLESTYFLTRLASATLITETISIWYFCLIFVAKLGMTIYQRRVMNQKQWSVLSIVFIMGGCTMVIPCKRHSYLTNPLSIY
jgi:pheromone alpha factor receptor